MRLEQRHICRSRRLGERMKPGANLGRLDKGGIKSIRGSPVGLGSGRNRNALHALGLGRA